MVISHLLGGIGNQMFQYAAGRSLSIATGQNYFLDLNDFSNYRLHNGFELSRVFDVNMQVADSEDVRGMLNWRAGTLAKKVLRRSYFKLLRGNKLVVEPSFNFWPEFFNLSQGCYLYGYWQSEKYFHSVEKVIRSEFNFREPLSGRNAELAIEIKNAQAVSLHVRRGDYVSDHKTGKIMDICSLEYYKTAVAYIVERVEQPIFYIFSDDIDWVKQSLPLRFPCKYVNHNRGIDSYRDMQLMSLCKHHVIANSTFSWWGAWLNSNPCKIVVAPRKWFRNGTSDQDLIPAEWIRL